jgi:diguanylate cyclase (GGDEF)-like protein
VRERDMVARTGGDEFVVVLADPGTEQNAAHEAAERIEAAFVEPLRHDSSAVQLHAAVGVACFPTTAAMPTPSWGRPTARCTPVSRRKGA